MYAGAWLETGSLTPSPNCQCCFLSVMQTAQCLRGLKVITKMSMTDHISMLCSHPVTEWTVTITESCIKRGKGWCSVDLFSPCCSHCLLFAFVHKEFPYDGWLGYRSHNNTAAPKTIIWISYAGELVSHPQRGVLQQFIHKDA